MAIIDDFKPIYIQRIAQLTNKSNQFNLTTLRCSEDDIKAMQASAEYICLCGRLVDKFADNGLVTIVIGQIHDKELHLILWLMSCRVLKRGLEDAMMNTVIGEAKKRGVITVIGHYYPTAKNAMVRNFYESMGFVKVAEDNKGNTDWELRVSDYTTRILHMEVEDLLL